MWKENFLLLKEHAIKEDGEVRAFLLHSKKPVISEDNMWKERFLVLKEHAIKEDGEVGASLLHSKKP
eukprot:9681981-Ditylum_brightwellii.AAC.1